MFRSLLTAAWLSVCASAFAAQYTGATISLKTHAKVTGSCVKLGDLAKLQIHDDHVRASLEHWCVIKTPRVSLQRKLTRQQLHRLMQSSWGDLAIQWRGASTVVVEAESMTIPWPTLAQAAEQFLMHELIKHYGTPSRVETTLLTSAGDIILPQSNHRLAPEVNSKTLHRSRINVWVNIYSDDELYSRVPIWFSVEAYKPVLVSQQPIAARHAAAHSDIAVVERNIAGLTAGALAEAADLQHSRFRRAVGNNHILRKHDIEANPEVVLADEVGVQVTIGSVLINTTGFAQEEGRLGDTIKVLNPRSDQVFSAVVIGNKQVFVDAR